MPIGAIAEPTSDGQIHLRAVVCSLDGRTAVRGELRGAAEAAAQVGAELAKRLRDEGAEKILESVRGKQARRGITS